MIPPWVWGALVENASPIFNTAMWLYMGLGYMVKTGNFRPSLLDVPATTFDKTGTNRKLSKRSAT